MSRSHPILMLDTNVWLDLYIPDRDGTRNSQELVAWALRHDVSLAFPSSTALDLHRLVAKWYKSWMRQEYGELSAAAAAAIKQHAWDCLSRMEEAATAIPVDSTDLHLARKYRDAHDDLEDNLVIAAALRANADYVVTNDRRLLRHAPVTALTPRNMLLALRNGDAFGPESEDRRAPSLLFYEWLSKEETGALDA